MAGITLAQAEAKLAEYLAAESKVLLGQEVMIDGVKRVRADLAAIRAGRVEWEAKVGRLSRPGGLSVREVIPR